MAIGTTAALLGAAAIGTAGSLASGAMQSSAAGKAADAQERAALAAADVQRDAITQTRIDAYPWALAGANALYQYMGELGIPMPKNRILPDLNAGPFAPGAQGQSIAQPQPNALQPAQVPQQPQRRQLRGALGRVVNEGPVNALQPQPQATAPQPTAPVQPTYPSPQDMEMTPALGFQETPGYQFQVEQGERAVLNNLAALGMKNSGAALKALTRYRQGVANQEYNNYLNRLASVAGMGQTQTNTTNTNTLNAAANIGNTMQDAGAARASGYVGQANAWSNALGGISNTWGNALGMLAFA